MNYKVTIKRSVKGMSLINLENEDSKHVKIFIDFYKIDTTCDDEELLDDLRIINGDIYDLCKGIFSQCFIICDWNDSSIKSSIELLKDYMKENDIDIYNYAPVFLVVNTEYGKFGDIVDAGFDTADHISDLENNRIFIMTSKNSHKKICKKYFLRNAYFID